MKLRERRRQNLQKWMNCLKTYLLDKFLTVDEKEANFRALAFHFYTITKK